MDDSALHDEARALLRRALNDPAAEFREGQWEAIQALVAERARLLVVQRTGWGKSVVYFITTRLLRDRGTGPTLLVSPLLALMRNQIAAATRLGVRAATINSSNRADWEQISADLLAGEIRLSAGPFGRMALDRARMGNEIEGGLDLETVANLPPDTVAIELRHPSCDEEVTGLLQRLAGGRADEVRQGLRDWLIQQHT